jgi:hypothetical protein
MYNPVIISHWLFCPSDSPPSYSQKETNNIGLFMLAPRGKKISKGLWSREREDLPCVVKEKRVSRLIDG